MELSILSYGGIISGIVIWFRVATLCTCKKRSDASYEIGSGVCRLQFDFIWPFYAHDKGNDD
jgi:hypothetical protein